MINEKPKIVSKEQDANALNIGTGGEIPIFISPTLNETPLTDITEYTKYAECNKLVSAGGIGVADTNYLSPVLKDFFDESLKINSDDIGVPHIYVKDLGAATPDNATPWTNAIRDIKIKNDVRVEAYVFQKPANANDDAITTLITNVASIMNNVATALDAEAEKGKPRIAYFTVLGLNDNQLKELTKSSNATKIQHSRVYLIEPKDFGKTIARICITPIPDEPGYYNYRSVNPEEFTERLDSTIEEMQQAGIIINTDERTSSNIYPRINLCVATSYAKGEGNRPTDSLLHARRNVDQMQREAIDIVYNQLKRRATSGYLTDTQADLDVLVYNKIEAGFMKKDTSITISEPENAPEELEVLIEAYPVNITGKITATTYIH